MKTLRNSTSWILAAAMIVSCGKRERPESSVRSESPAPAPLAARARVVPDLPDVRSVAEALKANKTGKNVVSIVDIRDALVRQAETNGTSFGSCLCQVFDIVSEGASDAEVDRLSRYLSIINCGDQDLLLSVLAAAPPGPLLNHFASTALGQHNQTGNGELKGYDLAEAYKVMPESSARKWIAVDWVRRISRVDGLAAAMAVVDSLQSAEERKAAVVEMGGDFAYELREGRQISDADISALRDKARAVGVEEFMLKGFPQTNKQP